MNEVKINELIEALISLVRLCEKETHRASGTVMFSIIEKDYQKAKKVVDRLSTVT